MATIPAELQQAVEAAVGAPLGRVEPLGGSFGRALVRVSAGGARFALKWSSAPAGGALAAEAAGLRLLAAPGHIRVPAVIAVSDPSPTGPSFLLSEWIEGDGSRPDQAALGEALAALHRTTAPAYGLDHDNFIGGTPQLNAWHADWPAFFRERRLQPQIERARRAGLLGPARLHALEHLMARLDDLLAGVPRRPSLIHGDLWGGNVVAAAGGAPALVDPAVAFCDREAEIAFTELFGGFTPRFYAAYNAAWPLEPGYAERRPLYNLYHALNHLNLFGAGYGSLVDELLAFTSGVSGEA